MPAFSHLPTPELLTAAERLYSGARDTPGVLDALADYDYDREDFAAGLALVAALRDAIGDQAVETAEARTATAAARAATDAVRRAYTRHRTLARRKHPRGTPGHSALALDGDTPDDDDQLLADADRFYATLEGAPDLAAPIRNLPASAIDAAQAAIDTAGAADATQTRETGEAQRATVARQTAERVLRAEAAELAEAAKLALEDQPQLREALGLLER
jgi:hypothetical protein